MRSVFVVIRGNLPTHSRNALGFWPNAFKECVGFLSLSLLLVTPKSRLLLSPSSLSLLLCSPSQPPTFLLIQPCPSLLLSESHERLGQNKQSDEEEECSDRKAAVVSLSFASSSSNDQLKNKDVVIAGTSSFVDDKDNPKNIRWWSHGSIYVIGRRREMEDAVAVEVGCLTRGSKGYDFFGVYDGHGGSRVANACLDRLHKLLLDILEQEDDMNTEGSINWNKVMMKSFEKIDEEVNRNGEAMATMGSTAVVAVGGA